jgi:hypothetical protein
LFEPTQTGGGILDCVYRVVENNSGNYLDLARHDDIRANQLSHLAVPP